MKYEIKLKVLLKKNFFGHEVVYDIKYKARKIYI